MVKVCAILKQLNHNFEIGGYRLTLDIPETDSQVNMLNDGAGKNFIVTFQNMTDGDDTFEPGEMGEDENE